MRRTAMILAAAAVFMVLLTSTSVSVAFAVPPEKWGHKCHEENEKIGIKGDENCGFHYSPDNR
jgi:hypothetical protein